MKSFRLLSLSAVIIALVSCIDELDKEEPFGQGYSVSSVSVTDQEGADTKSILVIDPQELVNLQVFAFDPSNGNILYYGEGAGAALKGKPVTAYVEGVSTFEWCLPVGVPLDIYAVANIGKISVPATVSELLGSDVMKFTFDSLEDLNARDGVPMSGILKNAVDNGSGNVLTIRMKKVLARFDVSLDFRDYEDIQITKLSIRNAHRHATLFASGEYASSASDLAPNMDYSTDDDLALLKAGERMTLYIPENMQTSGRGAKVTGVEKWYDVADAKAKTNMDFCTYLEISFQYTANGARLNSMRKLYFGKSPLADFDVVRNTKTNLNVRIGADIDDSFFEFSSSYYEVLEGGSTEVVFRYYPSVTVSASDFSVDVSGVTVSDVNVNTGTDADGMTLGSLRLNAGNTFDYDTEGLLTYAGNGDNVPSVDVPIKVDGVPLPVSLFFSPSSVSGNPGGFESVRICMSYSDGTVVDVTEDALSKGTMGGTNRGYASFVAPGEHEIRHDFVNLDFVNVPHDTYNQQYGVAFGYDSTAGVESIGCAYMGKTATLTATKELPQYTSSYEVYLLHGGSQDIDFTRANGFYTPTVGQTWGVDPVLIRNNTTTVHQVNVSGTKVTVASNNSQLISDSFTFDVYYYVGTTMGVGYISVTQTTGGVSKTYYYQKICTVKVSIASTIESQLGTVESVEIHGKDKVIHGDDCVYTAIAKCVDGSGVVTYRDITRLGVWTSDGFASQSMAGCFTGAYTGGSDTSMRYKDAVVDFTFNGTRYRKQVLVYKYSQFRLTFSLNSVYKLKEFFVGSLIYDDHSNNGGYDSPYAFLYDVSLVEDIYGTEFLGTNDRSYSYRWKDSKGVTQNENNVQYVHLMESKADDADLYDPSLNVDYTYDLRVENADAFYDFYGNPYPSGYVIKLGRTCYAMYPLDMRALNYTPFWEKQ